MKITRRQLRRIIRESLLKESLPAGTWRTQREMPVPEKQALVDRLGKFFERHVKQQQDLKDMRLDSIQYIPESSLGFTGDVISMAWTQYDDDRKPEEERPPAFYGIRPRFLFKGTPGLSGMRNANRAGQAGWTSTRTYSTFGIGETQSNWLKLEAWLDENESKTFTRKELGV